MEEYPKRVVLESENLTKLLTNINDLVLSGRELSAEIDELELELGELNKEMVAIEESVDISDIDVKVKAIIERVNTIKAEQVELEKEIYERCSAQVPTELKDKYEATKKLKEDKETQRNKTGLKIQKLKDKSIPLARKLMKPYLTDEFDDYNGVVLENGELVGTIFNHLKDWKEQWTERLRQKYMK